MLLRIIWKHYGIGEAKCASDPYVHWHINTRVAAAKRDYHVAVAPHTNFFLEMPIDFACLEYVPQGPAG